MSVRLRPVLLVGLLVLQAITVVAVVVGTGRNTEGLLVDAMGRTMSLASDAVDQRTSEHLAPAESAAALTSELLSGGVLAVDDDAALLAYLDAQVLSTPSISGVYVGRPDGSFLLVSRDGATEPGGTRVKTIEVGESGRRSVTVQRDASLEEVEAAEDPTDEFDPRERPWYRAALGADGVSWTDPYIFFASREPGVTTAAAARDADGEVMAVVGVDLSLRDLSTFVGTMEVGSGSRSILLDDSGLMLAAADLDQVNVDDGVGGLRRAAADEVSDPVVVAGIRAVGAEIGDLAAIDDALVVPFEVDGRRWQVAVSPLAARGPWLAAVMAPEDQFVTPVVEAQRDNVLIAALIALAVTALATPAVLAISRRVDRIASDAVTDPVTGVVNRREFDRSLADELRRAGPDHPVCVGLVDVDRFKPVNDTWGHGTGDQVLVVIAARLMGEMRDREVVARIGGDEFAVILSGISIPEAREVLERARRSVADTPARTDKAEIDMSVTIGMAVGFGADGDGPEALLDRADQALYAAKQAGRNRVGGPVEANEQLELVEEIDRH